MSLAYRILYLVGYTPWERMASSQPIVDQLARLFSREEADLKPERRRVLDLGCGSGNWSVALAKRGWKVTGVDFVPKALRRARRRAEEAGVDVNLIQADVTKLSNAGVGSGLPFFLDIGLFHDELSDEQRAELGREVTAIAATDATLLIMAWTPGKRGPLPRGASQAEIEAAYPTWEVVDQEPMETAGAPGYVVRAEPRFYRLRRGTAGTVAAGP
jgi:SAM-dependent methyltransferase